ncbi:MAG: response regulator [Candidatus Omnitrophota bacterium]|jgi:DNA-binding response OmpR family regulator
MDKKKILVVDDEEDILSILRLRLEANNYEVLTASDGQEGLDKARAEKPDLMILDLMLPKLDGYEVCRMLKLDEAYKTLPIIIVTAMAEQKYEDIGGDMGADAYITKPFEPEILLNKIRELLNK